jgi:uncharacterized protein (TIGR02001 family)
MKRPAAAGLAGMAGMACLVALASTTAAFAQTTVAPAAASTTEATPPVPTPDWTFTGNANLYSDYRFRGFSQTGYKPAFQGGVDLAHVSGFYVGNWNSNVEQGLYRGASLEMDFYGGYKYTFLDDFTIDVGLYYYYYPTKQTSGGGYAGFSQKADEGEGYIGFSYKTYSIKYWYAFTNYFGLGDSFQHGPSVDTSGSGYLEGNATYDLGDGWGVVGHLGYQYVKNNSQFTDVTGATLPHSVIDWKVGATKDFSGWVVGLSAIGTTKKNYFGTATSFEAGGKVRPLLSVSKTF